MKRLRALLAFDEECYGDSQKMPDFNQPVAGLFALRKRRCPRSAARSCQGTDQTGRGASQRPDANRCPL
jgi:hypothetical protein